MCVCVCVCVCDRVLAAAWLSAPLSVLQLVPRHIVQAPDEKRELLERYKLKEQQLPRIRTNDPIAKYFGLRRGQVRCVCVCVCV